MAGENIDLSNIWGLRASGIDLSAIARPITQQEIEFLLDQHPFIQVVNTEGTFDGERIDFLSSKSGWTIFSYKNAMCASLGNFLPATEYIEPIEPNSANPVSKLDIGTIYKQAATTAQDILAIAIRDKWKGIEIINGTPFMKWVLAIFARIHGLQLFGFEFDQDAENRYKKFKLLHEKQEEQLRVTQQLQ